MERFLRKAPVLLLCAAFLAAMGGCVRQRVRVNSDPSGARVYFDGYYKGETPLEFPFKWHGPHRLTLEKEGHVPASVKMDLRAPWYMTVPLDMFIELAPFPVREEHSYYYELRPEE